MRKYFIVAALAISVNCLAEPLNLSKIYLDNQKNVHVITSAGKHIKLTKSGNSTKASLSPDGKTAAWLVNNTWIPPGESTPSASELQVYRSSGVRSIKCEPFIRDYWFWQKGRSIAIDCGSLHFAGSEILYDIATTKEIERFDQAEVPPEERPKWSISIDKYTPSK